MPKLWTETIESHRREVRDAILDAAGVLAAGYGVLSVTMSQIAETTGIGRATLYKYFPDVEAILLAWHDRQITAHLAQLAAVVEEARAVGRDPLEAVLDAYALISYESRGHHDTEFPAFLHRDDRVAQAWDHVHGMMRDLLTEAAGAGLIRIDVPLDELATYCVHTLTGAGSLRSKAAVGRLMKLTLAGLQP